MHKVIIFLTVVIFGACTNADTASTNAEIFDLAKFINNLGNDKNFADCKVEKLLFIDGKERERIEARNYNAIKDLNVVKLSNINRPALIEKYSADTTTVGGITQLHYEALDPDMNVQSLHVQQKGKEVIEIRIEKKMKSIIAESDQVIWFNPKIGYSISNKQKVLSGQNEDSEIQVNFIK